MKITVDHSPEFKQKLIELVEQLEEELGRLEKVEIVPSEKEIFRVSINGKVVMDLENEEFSAEKVLKAIDEEDNK